MINGKQISAICSQKRNTTMVIHLFWHASIAFQSMPGLNLCSKKTADEIIKALERILASGRKPKRLQSDRGSEFTNKKVQLFLRKHNIQFFTTDSELKASIVERFNRTLKTRMSQYLQKGLCRPSCIVGGTTCWGLGTLSGYAWGVWSWSHSWAGA